jgi:hypothetical protein
MMHIYVLLFWMINAANIMSVLVQGNFLNLLVEIRSSPFKMNYFMVLINIIDIID